MWPTHSYPFVFVLKHHAQPTTHSNTESQTYQVIWRVSMEQSLAHIPVWLQWQPAVSQGGRESAGRRFHQLMRFPWLQACGWQRAVWWLLSGAGECWRRSGEPWESPLWTQTVQYVCSLGLGWSKNKTPRTTRPEGSDIRAWNTVVL